MVLDDGRVARRVGAILWYFGEGSRFVPAGSATSARRCSSGCSSSSTSHEPPIAVVRFWLAYSGRAAEQFEAAAPRTSAGYRALDVMERHLAEHEWFVGER